MLLTRASTRSAIRHHRASLVFDGFCILLVVMLAAGCAKVEPQADFRRAAQSIEARTGVAGVDRPSAGDSERAVEVRITGLLEGGLTLDEAVEIALLNNPGFQSLFEEIGISRAEVVQSGLLSNPSISGLVKFPEAGGRASLDLGFSQELVDLWQIPIRRRIAQAKLEQTIAAVAQRAVDLAAQAKTDYYQLRTAQLEQESIAASARVVADAIQVMERQAAAGAVSRFDLNLARAALMDVQLEQFAAEHRTQLARVELGQTLGLSCDRYPTQLTNNLPTPEPVGDAQRLCEYALTERYDLRVAQMELDAAEDEVVRQAMLIVPSVVAGVGMERPERQALPGRNLAADAARSSIRNGTLSAPEIQTRTQRAEERRQVIDFLAGPSFQVTVPLFDQNQARIAAAAARVRQRRQDMRERTLRAQGEIAMSLASRVTAGRQVEFYQREAIPIAEANEAGARSTYASGAQNVLVLLEAQRSLIARRRGCIEAQGAYAAARVALERAVGGRLPTAAAAPTTAPAASQPAEVSP